MTTTTIDHRPADDRFHTDLGWLDSRHSFSFGSHRDPSNVGHGLLIVSNDDRVAPGGGFGTHPHRDMEIVTWVLSGALEHRDSTGTHGIITPGLAQRMSAGAGIQHSEVNASATEPVHFVQMWVPPARSGTDPGYAQRDVTADLEAGDLVPIVSGRDHDGALSIEQPGATMWVARLAAGDRVSVPDGRFVHVFVALGRAELDGCLLAEGDAARLTDAGRPALHAVDGCEIIIWESDQQAWR